MGQLSRLPRKVEGPNVPSLPPRMSLSIKTAPNPFHGAARPAALSAEPMPFSIPKQKLKWIIVQEA